MKTVDTKHLETKSDAKREADAIARLRETALTHSDFIHVPVRVADITALLGRAALLDEALDALKMTRDAEGSMDPPRARRVALGHIDAVLAKAGRR